MNYEQLYLCHIKRLYFLTTHQMQPCDWSFVQFASLILQYFISNMGYLIETPKSRLSQSSVGNTEVTSTRGKLPRNM